MGKSYNKTYGKTSVIKKKQKGRNRDINVKDMNDYKALKKQYEKYNQRLTNTNQKTKNVDVSSKEINKILDNLKPTTFNKNNKVISNEDIEIIKNYTKDVKDTNKSIRNVNDLNILIEDFENSYNNVVKENNSLKYQLEQKNDEINYFKNELSTKDKIISKLQAEKEKIKQELQKFKNFWHSIMNHFHKRICYDKDENYKIVSDDIYKNGIFTDDENEIANNISRKVKPKENIEKSTNKKKDNFELK